MFMMKNNLGLLDNSSYWYMYIFIFNSGPAPAGVTEKIFDLSKKINEYYISPALKPDIGTIGSQQYAIEGFGNFTVQIVDSVQDYSDFMKEIFDFPAIRKLLTDVGADGKRTFKVLVNALHGGMYYEVFIL